jgi:hypothetical protein
MRNRLADAFERGQRSRACLEASHDGCAHLIGSAGGGFNPRRFRFEAGEMLCKCPCHANCAITSTRATVALQVGQESCSCLGAPAPRASQEEGAMNPRPPYQPYVPRHSHESKPT